MVVINVHDVIGIHLTTRYLSIGNMRRIRFTDLHSTFEVTLYGKTDALDSLPKSDDFCDYDGAQS